MTPGRILAIDDDSDICDLICATAEEQGLPCSATTSAMQFLESLSPDISLLLIDLIMPEMDGVELLRRLGERQCKINIVLMSGVGKRIMEVAEELAHAHGLSTIGHLQKPFRAAELEAILEKHGRSVAAPDARPRSRVAVEDDDVRRAIEEKEFVLHYQPQVDIASGKVVGVEALARWLHPELGLIFPEDFIPRLEELGLIDQLGWIVARRGLVDLNRFKDRSGVAPRLAFNVSVSSLTDLRFPDSMSALIAGHGVAPDNINLEITESGLIKELARTLDVLARLRIKRVNLSIDDFGTGYSMMQQLRNIPATELKIDRSFVMNMMGSDRDRVMVQKTIEIGHELEMKVVAEGVETAEQLELLRLSGCDGAQGYLFSHPLPADELVHWLSSYRTRRAVRPELSGIRLVATR
ncbi:MAG TPA: EAL domain-containing response regulator [Terracidiphilus sp.]|jgi:EAL domain-containing protein (putative c-di-GMP-specific phosphodiesterase class I)